MLSGMDKKMMIILFHQYLVHDEVSIIGNWCFSMIEFGGYERQKGQLRLQKQLKKFLKSSS